MGWWKKTDFWIALILFAIGITGLARGNEVIADPGQEVDPRLAWLYLLAGVVMIVNGILSHRQHLRDLEEQRQKQAQSTTQREVSPR